MKWFRSASAVLVAGALMIAVLHYSSAADFLAATLITVSGAIVAGYLAALVGGTHELAHAAGVGMVMISVIFISMRQRGVFQPGLYETTVAGCGPIGALFGAALRMLTKRKP